MNVVYRFLKMYVSKLIIKREILDQKIYAE